MVGVGAYFSGADRRIAEFVEATGIPVFSDFQAHGLLAQQSSALWRHVSQDGGSVRRRAAPRRVLALGVRFGLFTLGMSDAVVPLAAKIIHVEIDPKEIGRLRQVAVPIVADPRETLHALNAQAKSKRWPDRKKWQQTIRDAKDGALQGPAKRSGSPGAADPSASSRLGDRRQYRRDAIIVGDGAEAYHWMNEVIHQNHPGQLHHPRLSGRGGIRAWAFR